MKIRFQPSKISFYIFSLIKALPHTHTPYTHTEQLACACPPKCFHNAYMTKQLGITSGKVNKPYYIEENVKRQGIYS